MNEKTKGNKWKWDFSVIIVFTVLSFVLRIHGLMHEIHEISKLVKKKEHATLQWVVTLNDLYIFLRAFKSVICGRLEVHFDLMGLFMTWVMNS